MSVAAVAVAAVDLDKTRSAFEAQNQPQVAAIRGGANRGQGRGQRGQRGQRGGRGGNRGGQSSNSKPRGPRHASNPPDSCCDRHYVHGEDAWYCLKPQTCPWKDKCTPRP